MKKERTSKSTFSIISLLLVFIVCAFVGCSCENEQDTVTSKVVAPQVQTSIPGAKTKFNYTFSPNSSFGNTSNKETSARDVYISKKALSRATLHAKNKVNYAMRSSDEYGKIRFSNDFQNKIKTLSTEKLIGISKKEWLVLVNKSDYSKKNRTVKLVPYNNLRKVLWVKPTSAYPYIKISCALLLRNVYFAAFESKYHYFIVSVEKHEVLRSNILNWHVCRKKDNVQVFSGWSSELAIKLEDGILTGEGFTTAGPQHKVSFTRQRGNKPALTFKSVDSFEPPITTQYTVFFDSRGISEIRPIPPSGNGVTTH